MAGVEGLLSPGDVRSRSEKRGKQRVAGDDGPCEGVKRGRK
jgi:hypothetical protein